MRGDGGGAGEPRRRSHELLQREGREVVSRERREESERRERRGERGERRKRREEKEEKEEKEEREGREWRERGETPGGGIQWQLRSRCGRWRRGRRQPCALGSFLATPACLRLWLGRRVSGLGAGCRA